MNIDVIINTLRTTFQQPLNDGEQRRIVFWLDREQEFNDYIDEITLENVKIHRLSANNSFYSKYLLEEEDITSHYLIYCNLDLSIEDNWLADTLLYSRTFYADKLSLIMNELKLDPALRTIVKKYEKFFSNKDRLRKFKSYDLSSFSEESIEIAIMSVLCNLKTSDFEGVLKLVLMDSIEERENKYLDLIEKYLGVEVFWRYVSGRYGYLQPNKTLKTFMIHLTISALSHSINDKHLTTLSSYIAKKNITNTLVFVDHWIHHKTDYPVYDQLSEMVEQEIKLADLVNKLPVEEFKSADTFPYFDKAIIKYIANSLDASFEDYTEYIKLINLRRVKHFYDRFQTIYEALFYTVKMFEFYKKHKSGIPQSQALELYQAYVGEYYKMDTYYRKFYVAFDHETNSEIMKKLKVLVENLYTNWFMGELSTRWSKSVDIEMKQNWLLPGIDNQKNFYSSFISPKIRQGDRVFVIISDAFRYEIAVELTDKLNSETIGSCDIQPLLGVVPSVTKLGMAALLPHSQLEMDLAGKVYVDSYSTSGIENRKKIVESTVPESAVVHYQEMNAMNQAGRREYFKNKKLVYVYHDTIDAMGDKASTEIYTFNAVEKAIEEIYKAVKIIRDDLGGTNIFITADHGFVYQREALEESDKIEKEPITALEVKRRYLLSQEKREVSGLLDINLNSILQNEHQLTAYVPKATIRFKMQGSGVNFVHGGASLQEIVVPLIQYKNVRNGQSKSRKIEKVDIRLTSTSRKVTNSLFHLNFFQTEKVEEKQIPRTVKIYMADDRDSIISNEETIICDRAFDKPEERTFQLRLALKSMAYDKHKDYFLVIKDTETGFIVGKVAFRINLGIVSDFDF